MTMKSCNFSDIENVFPNADHYCTVKGSTTESCKSINYCCDNLTIVCVLGALRESEHFLVQRCPRRSSPPARGRPDSLAPVSRAPELPVARHSSLVASRVCAWLRASCAANPRCQAAQGKRNHGEPKKTHKIRKFHFEENPVVSKEKEHVSP